MLRISFWLLMVGTLAISIVPPENAPTVFSDDKLNHILAFFTLSFLARLLWPHLNVMLLFSTLALFGGAIELLQHFMGFGRTADWMDFVADITAIVMGISVAQMINGFRKPKSIEE